MDPPARAGRERRLLRAVLAGDEGAWRAWYDESYAPLYAYALWRCGGLRDAADELVQDTWLTAVRRLRAFDPGRGSFLGWLRGIAANLLRNALRAEDARRCRLPLVGGEPTGPPPDAELEVREQAERVARALASLPDRYERVLRAKYLEGQSVAAIAAPWGESHKAVESLLTRARLAFRTAYDERGRAPVSDIFEGPPDSLDALVAPPDLPADGDALRDALRERTVGVLRARRRRRRLAAAAALAVCVGGPLLVWAWWGRLVPRPGPAPVVER